MAHLETRLIHAGHDAKTSSGAVVTPIFQTSTFRDHTHDPSRTHDPVRYTRLSNGPQNLVLQDRLAAITETGRALTTSSGMAAISATLIALGGRVFFSRHLYGGTAHLVNHDLPRLGIPCDIASNDDVSTWESEIHPDTTVLYVEAISNPTNVILDLEAVVALARRRNLIAVIDATFASPVNLLPARLGFDLEIHSATKYLNGHSDLIAGVVAGRADLVERVHVLQNHLGGSPDPHALFLLERGLKTLALRVRHQNRSALALAQTLAAHPKVRHTTHPLITQPAGHPHFQGYGGVFSFDLGDAAAAERLFESLSLATPAPSLGGPETLVSRPAVSSHASVPRQTRESLGISDGLIRVSVGFEHEDDLRADFIAALDRL